MGDKTNQQLIAENAENAELRQRVTALEGSDAERRRAEEELAQSKAMLKATIECLPFDVFAIGEDGRYMLENAVCRANWGRLVGKTPEEVASTEAIRALWLENNRRAWAGEKVEDVMPVTVKGEERFLYSVITPIRDETHSYGILGVNVDITQRKRAQQALQKAHDELEQRVQERTADLAQASEQLAIFRKFAEASQEGFGMSDFDGRIVYANPSLCRLFGEERPEQVIGNIAATYYPQAYAQRRKEEMIPALLREGLWQAEQTVLPRRGQPIQTLQSTFLIRDENGNPFRIAVVISDITERRAAEEALRQSERRFRNYFEQGLIGMAVTSVDKRWREVNDRLCEILGYRREELLQSNWDDLTYPDDIEPNLQLFNRLVAGEIEHFTLDKRFLKKDGSIVYTTIHIRAFRNDDGSIDHIVSLTEDITARKQAEEALRQSHNELRAIYDGMADGLLIADIETKRFVRANDWICRMLGYTKDEILAMSVRDIHPAEQVSACEEAMHAQVEGRLHVNPNVPVQRKDGTVFYADVAGRGLVFAGRPCVIGFFRDITKRKVAQEALRQNHDQLRTIYDGIVEGLLIADIETKRVRRVNASFCRMLGYCEEELLKKSIPDLHPPEEVSNDLARFRAAAEGRVSVNENRPVLRKDGSLFYADITGHRILYQGRLCLLALFRDVTERRQAQAARERERRTLEHMLRASDHERQLIAYDIHDGLAQYLTGAIMHLQMSEHLREQDAAESAKAFDGGMALLRQGHSEARRLISGVRPPILDDSGVLAAISHLIHDPAFEQGPKIEFRSKVTFSRLATVVENVIYRIVQEGLSNARNHSKSKNIVVSLIQQGKRLRIEVQDWGVGFDPKTVQENRFGLEGIRERARLLGGKCNIKSKPGEGTAVVVVLPVVEQKVGKCPGFE